MNILINSAGRRVKIIEYFKNALIDIGNVIAVDCDKNAPALYFADNYEIVPRIDNPNYIKTLIGLCKKHSINGIISLIDPELELLAKHKDDFDKEGVQLILSPLEVIKYCFDKFETYQHLNDISVPAVPTIKNYNDAINRANNGELGFPVIVKPAKGSASLGIKQLSDKEQLQQTLHYTNGLIIQPHYLEKEFGIDVYVDMVSGELVDLFIKEKVNMRSGETDKSISIHNKKIESLIKDFISKTHFIGPIDIDCFEFEGKYYISEINPRFGGGYPHAYEMGCDFTKYIVNNLYGKENLKYAKFNYEANYGMMKYDNIKLKKMD